jgi:hypothetical protein
MSNKSEPIVNAAERESILWKKLNAHFDMTIDNLRLRLEKDLDLRESDKIRGQIKALKMCKALDRDIPIIE